MIGLFTIENIVGATMAKQMKTLLREFGLLNKVVAFMKDERANLKNNDYNIEKHCVMSHIHLPTPFARICWGHAMSKTTLYAMNNNKVCQSF